MDIFVLITDYTINQIGHHQNKFYFCVVEDATLIYFHTQLNLKHTMRKYGQNHLLKAECLMIGLDGKIAATNTYQFDY